MLSVPSTLQPLLGTINALHLRSIAEVSSDSWELDRDRYLETRLLSNSGQLAYYRSKAERATRLSRAARGAFVAGSGLAISAVALELLMAFTTLPALGHNPLLVSVLGASAIVFPVVTVAGLSLAASFDVEARSHTYTEMAQFISLQAHRLQTTTSRATFRTLVLETELRLLGETVNWHFRRAFIGVS
jgi:hypothetical protein